jgi:integrase
MRFVDLADYHLFSTVGLRGLDREGAERPGARDRNGLRNALFAELLVTTGLRLEEASFLLATELPSGPDGADRQLRLMLPAALTKGERGRSVLLPSRLVPQLAAYVAVERAAAAAKFAARRGWEAFDRPILIQPPQPGSAMLRTIDGRGLALEVVTPEERARLVLCGEDGAPRGPAVLWLTEVGQPVQPNSWEAVFARASRRCAEAGVPLYVTPHQLRHTFAVHMLAMLIQQRLRQVSDDASAMDGYRHVIGDPLQQVQRLLGHASLTTTMIYLDHVASRADTVDAAVEELLALVPQRAAP